jgi:hypothetical protein
MMNRIVHSILLLAGFFLFSSRSCDSFDAEETNYSLQQIVDIKDSGLESAYISDEAKIAFENKARQMLMDFADYYSIYADTKLDSVFRNNARGMLEDLFYDDSITINIKTGKQARAEIPTLQQFLDVSAQSDSASRQLKIHTIEISRALMRLNESTYTGTLQFDLDNFEIIAADTISIQKASRQCEFTVVKVNKAFGQQTKSVWQVFLGNIYGK